MYSNNIKALKRLKNRNNCKLRFFLYIIYFSKESPEYMYACLRSVSEKRDTKGMLEDKTALGVLKEGKNFLQCDKPVTGFPCI